MKNHRYIFDFNQLKKIIICSEGYYIYLQCIVYYICLQCIFLSIIRYQSRDDIYPVVSNIAFQSFSFERTW